MIGSLVVGEHIFPIESVTFGSGTMLLITERKEPPASLRIEGETEYRVHGIDGSLIFVERGPWPGFDPSADTLAIRLPLRIVGAVWDSLPETMEVEA